MCASRSVVSDSLWPHGLGPARLLCPWNSPGKNTGVCCHALLQGIFPTQGSNLGLLLCRQILYRLSHQHSWRSPLTRPRASQFSSVQSLSHVWLFGTPWIVGWVTSGQKTTKEGVPPHPSADNWIKALLSKALPTRARPSFSHYQSLPSGSLHKPLSLLLQRAEARRTTVSQWLKQKPHYRKLTAWKSKKLCPRWRDKIKCQKNN